MSSHTRKALAVASALATPFAPTLCPICFAQFAKAIEPADQSAPLLQTKCHPFWTALMRFIAADWTLERQEYVSGLLQRQHVLCRSCKPAGKIATLYHEIPDAESFFGLVYQFACLSVSHALTNPRNSFKGIGLKPARWPATAQQLFPYGAELTVRGLVAQLQHRRFVHAVLYELLYFHRPIVFPVLLLPDLRAILIATFLSRLRSCTLAANAALARLSSSSTPAARHTTAQEHVAACETLVLILFDIVTGRAAQPDDRARFCLGHEVELFKSLHDFLTMARSNYFGDNHIMGHVASHLWIALSPSQREDMGVVEPPVYTHGLERIADLNDPYLALRYYLRTRLPRHVCCGPGCTSAAARLSLCARCRTAVYCSRACQRADWTDAPLVPHKAVCAALGELRALGAYDAGPEDFSAACAAHGVPLARVDTLIAWATHGRIATHFALGGESVSDLMKPLDKMRPANPEDMDAIEPGSKNVYLKLGGRHEFIVTFPPGQDGRTISDREMYQGLASLKAQSEAEGLPMSWRSCQT